MMLLPVAILLLHFICMALRISPILSQSFTIERRILNNGFHRNLKTSLQLEDVVNCKEENLTRLLLEEVFPSGMFVDPYQIENMIPFGGPEVLFTNAIDVEKAEYLSSLFTLYMYLHPFCSQQSGQYTVKANVTLPIHLRYHRPSSDPDVHYALIMISQPNVYREVHVKDNIATETKTIKVQCSTSSLEPCHWRKIHSKKITESLEIQVPIGNMEHFNVVTYGTIVTTVVGCGLVILTVLKKKMSSNCDKLS